MTAFHLLPAKANVQPLLDALARQPELWNQHRMRKDTPGTPHGQMDDIWLRYNAWENFDGCPRRFAGEHEAVWYPAAAALPEAKPLIFGLMQMVEGVRLGGVLITRIPPGGRIEPHTDAGWHPEHYSKFYIQLESCPGADFICGEERFCPEPGDVYEFDNRVEHSVENNGTGNRTTLIVCVRTEATRTR